MKQETTFWKKCRYNENIMNCRYLNYTEHLFILASTVTVYVSTSAFASLAGFISYEFGGDDKNLRNNSMN